jgi:hypothetical protein
MSFRADLRTSPYAQFAASTTPVGLYARRAWLEEKSAALRRAERKALRRILAAQRSNGSFGSLASTIGHLYALHLLQKSASHESDRALDWLWETGLPRPEPCRCQDGVVYHDLPFRLRPGDRARIQAMTGTPFARGCAGFIKTGAAISLASAFGRGREARVQRALRCLDDVIDARKGLWCSPACSLNILQAYADAPDGARSRGLAAAVRSLGRRQKTTGSWQDIPFARTFSILASIDTREARAQVRRAIGMVRRTQNPDGSWGRGPGRELTSFLMVRALRAIEA